MDNLSPPLMLGARHIEAAGARPPRTPSRLRCCPRPRAQRRGPMTANAPPTSPPPRQDAGMKINMLEPLSLRFRCKSGAQKMRLVSRCSR